jgi:uncharacterized protein (DUF2132 family)
MAKFLAFFLACISFSQSAFAWGSLGHQVVAQIAYNHLDPEVKAKCNALLTNAAICGSSTLSFVASSTWADQRCEAYTATNHYIDLAISLDGTSTNGLALPDQIHNVVLAIHQYTAILQDTNATVNAQANALRYLLHFVGDIQQPMHCSSGVSAAHKTGDAGGNLFSLNGTWSNLHSLWDAGGGYLSSGTASSIAATVEAAYPYSFSVGVIPDPMDWAFEGAEIARTNAYVGITEGSTPSTVYLNKVQATTAQRMAIGGQRLAKLLNTILVTNAPSITSVVLTDDNFLFSWGSVSGRTYRVQWKDQISDSTWNDLTDITATATSVTFTNPASQPQRLYRAIVVN